VEKEEIDKELETESGLTVVAVVRTETKIIFN
jgi:hypothetical protein